LERSTVEAQFFNKGGDIETAAKAGNGSAISPLQLFSIAISVCIIAESVQIMYSLASGCPMAAMKLYDRFVLDGLYKYEKWSRILGCKKATLFPAFVGCGSMQRYK
jgi:hypothetical protein